MADWAEIARESLKAGQRLADDGCYRSAVSRCYYAAFSAVTSRLQNYGCSAGREAPAHARLGRLLEERLAGQMNTRQIRELKAKIWRLYSERICADYRATVNVDRTRALQSRQDAYSVCRVLGVL